jgi:hypothetical protein
LKGFYIKNTIDYLLHSEILSLFILAVLLPAASEATSDTLAVSMAAFYRLVSLVSMILIK